MLDQGCDHLLVLWEDAVGEADPGSQVLFLRRRVDGLEGWWLNFL